MEIIDNYLSYSNFKTLQDIIESSDFPWYYQNSVALSGQEQLPEFYFTHTIYNADTRIASPFFEHCKILLDGINCHTLIRMKSNLYPNLGRPITNSPHVDFPWPHKGAIFYVNSNNGYTILENGDKVESKENRMLLFDSSKSHCSTHCTDTKVRININLNYY
jgi:hypothetical protein